jgi:hypothetical protein
MTATSISPIEDSLLRRRLVALIGWLSVFLTLALLGPGVIAARADDVPAGPSCQDGGGPSAEQQLVELEQVVAAMRAQAEARGEDPSDIVVLNNRGYNYGADREREPSASEGERGN